MRVTAYAPMGYALAIGAGIAFLLALVAARRRWTVAGRDGSRRAGPGRGVEAGRGMPRAAQWRGTSSGNEVADIFKHEFVAASQRQLSGSGSWPPRWQAACCWSGAPRPRRQRPPPLSRRRLRTPVAWGHDLHRCFLSDAIRPAPAAFAGGSAGRGPRCRHQEGAAGGAPRLLRRRGPRSHCRGKSPGALRSARCTSASRSCTTSTCVSSLEEKGAIFVDETDEVPEGALVIFSAHGVSPAVVQSAEDRGLRTIDATCPLVTKVHKEAVRFAEGRLRHPADRPRRPRGSRRHRRRGPRTHPDHQRPA